MEKIINPEMQHLAENIFLNLNYADLKKCQLMNQSTSQILDNPMYWMMNLAQAGLSKIDQTDWIKAIRSETNSEKKKHIATYLRWNLKKKNFLNLPCYTKPAVQNHFRKKIQKICVQSRPTNEHTKIVKILAPLMNNPNAPNDDGETPIDWAAENGHTEIVKILAGFTDNPKAHMVSTDRKRLIEFIDSL